jgi:hypothetical protein
MEYLIKDFTIKDNSDSLVEPRIMVVSEDEMFRIVDGQADSQDKIVVFRIPENPVIDWS